MVSVPWMSVPFMKSPKAQKKRQGMRDIRGISELIADFRLTLCGQGEVCLLDAAGVHLWRVPAGD